MYEIHILLLSLLHLQSPPRTNSLTLSLLRKDSDYVRSVVSKYVEPLRYRTVKVGTRKTVLFCPDYIYYNYKPETLNGIYRYQCDIQYKYILYCMTRY